MLIAFAIDISLYTIVRDGENNLDDVGLRSIAGPGGSTSSSLSCRQCELPALTGRWMTLAPLLLLLLGS
jgi:hypothetical protein